MSSGGLGGFESEVDIEERRKKRQEEWEKVRTADQPESKKQEKYKIVQTNWLIDFVFSCAWRSLRWKIAVRTFERAERFFDKLLAFSFPILNLILLDAKQDEFEEARKFKNMIRGLDDDDVDHLHEVDTRKVQQEREQREEQERELNDYRTKVQELAETAAETQVNLATNSIDIAFD